MEMEQIENIVNTTKNEISKGGGGEGEEEEEDGDEDNDKYAFSNIFSERSLG